MEAIVVRALTKIAADCPRKQGALKKQCRETLGEFSMFHFNLLKEERHVYSMIPQCN